MTELETLINTTRIFSQNIRMEFSMKKCALLNIRRGTLEKTTQPEMRALGEHDRYKYLEVLEAETIKAAEMKSNTGNEYMKSP